jgi:hypothetical protein
VLKTMKQKATEKRSLHRCHHAPTISYKTMNKKMLNVLYYFRNIETIKLIYIAHNIMYMGIKKRVDKQIICFFFFLGYKKSILNK